MPYLKYKVFLNLNKWLLILISRIIFLTTFAFSLLANNIAKFKNDLKSKTPKAGIVLGRSTTFVSLTLLGKSKFGIYTNKIYTSIFKEKADEYREVLNLSQKEKIRDTMYSEVLDIISSYPH